MMNALPADAETACANQFDLFTSTQAGAHERAKTLCKSCPVFDACSKLRPKPDEFDGTWAGVGYGIRKTRTHAA